MLMAKYYTKNYTDKEIEKQIEEAMNVVEPNKKSIDFILNYSKSLSVQKSKEMGDMFLNLN